MRIRWHHYSKSKKFKIKGLKLVILYLCLEEKKNANQLAEKLRIKWTENIRRMLNSLYKEKMLERTLEKPYFYKTSLVQLAKEIRLYYEDYLSRALKIEGIDKGFLSRLRKIIKHKDSYFIQIFREAFRLDGKSLYFNVNFLQTIVDGSLAHERKIAELSV